MSRADVDDQPHNFKPVGAAVTPIVARLQMLALGDALAASIDDPLAADLMRAIVGAMTCRNPKLGISMLGAQVAVALRNRDVRRGLQVTPLRDDLAPLPQWRRAL